MPITYQSQALKTSSEKTILCHIEPSERLVLFTLDSGSVYKRVTNYFVIDFQEDGTSLINGASPTLNAGEWFYEASTTTLYIRASDSADPKTHQNNVIYRLFLSNAPMSLPYDLASGSDVSYEARYISNSAVNKELDEEQIGIALESKTKIKLNNNDRFFDDIFDTLFWENKRVVIYSYFRNTALSEKKKIFEGIIQDKTYGEKSIGFNCQDYLLKLREPVQLDRFTTADGTLTDSILGTPKRRIYGKVKQAKTVPIDAVIDGFSLTGTSTGRLDVEIIIDSTNKYVDFIDSVTLRGAVLTEQTTTASVLAAEIGTAMTALSPDTITCSFNVPTREFSIESNGSVLSLLWSSGVNSPNSVAATIGFDNTTNDTGATYYLGDEPLDLKIIGTGTAYLDEVSPGDTLIIPVGDDTIELAVDEVNSDTEITISEIERTFAGETIKNSPELPWRKKNRNWHIAGHKLREPTTIIDTINSGNRFTLDSVADMFEGDLLDFDGTEDEFIKRISGNEVILESVLQLSHSPGGTVTKNPISKVFIGTSEAFINRDWIVSNTTEAILNLDDLAEFNVAKDKRIVGSYTFTSGSRDITTSGAPILPEKLKPRDWIKNRDDITHQTWYEILKVTDDAITLRIAYGGSTDTAAATIRNPELLNDDSLVTVDTMGMEKNSLWVKTGADAVKDMIVNDALLTDIDTDSFDDAAIEADFILSMIIPANIGNKPIKIKTAISKINDSIFGSLSNNNDFQITYGVLSPERPTDMATVRQDASLKIKYSSKNDIVRKVNATYSPFVDIFTGENTTSLYEFENDFVDNFTGIKDEKDIDLLLFEEGAAQIIAQKWAMFNSMSQSTVEVAGKMDFTLLNLNEKVFLTLDRLYKRFGGSARQKIGIINKIVKDGLSSSITINDLGNQFNRTGAISPDTDDEFTSADDDQKMRNAYILDDDTELPENSSDREIFTSLIG